MTPIDETDVLASFNRRLAGIEADVKDGSASELPRHAFVTGPVAWRPKATSRRVVVSLLVALAVVVVIGVIRPIAARPGPSAGPAGSLPAIGASPSPSNDLGQGPARLLIEAFVQRAVQSGPPGIDAPGGLLFARFRVTVTSRIDAGAVTIPAGSTNRELDLTAGAYSVDVVDQLERPDGPCALQVTLAAGTTTQLTVIDVLGQGCTFGQGLIAPSPSPLPATASGPLPPTIPIVHISKARATTDAEEEVPAGATYESISAGSFSEVQLPPRWLSLDQLVVVPARPVWVIRFTDPSTCPGRHACGETVVYLDYFSGDFLVSIRVPGAP